MKSKNYFLNQNEKVYLAGQPDQYDNWRKSFENIKGFNFYNPDTDSN